MLYRIATTDYKACYLLSCMDRQAGRHLYYILTQPWGIHVASVYTYRHIQYPIILQEPRHKLAHYHARQHCLRQAEISYSTLQSGFQSVCASFFFFFFLYSATEHLNEYCTSHLWLHSCYTKTRILQLIPRIFFMSRKVTKSNDTHMNILCCTTVHPLQK